MKIFPGDMPQTPLDTACFAHCPSVNHQDTVPPPIEGLAYVSTPSWEILDPPLCNLCNVPRVCSLCIVLSVCSICSVTLLCPVSHVVD